MSKLLSTSTVPLSELGRVLVRAGALGSITLLVYDYFCTLYQEIELVWRSPFSLASMMFFVNRYLPFFDRIVSVNFNFNASISAEQCLFQAQAISWLMFIGIVISELILTLRTYAVWERKRSILITLIILTVVFLVPAIVFTELAVSSLRFISHGGCRMTSASNIIFLAFCLLTMYETILAILIAIQACKHLRQTRSRWVTKLYKDGIMFYVYLLVLSCANIVSCLLAPALGPWLQAPQRVVHSVLCTRVLFLIFQRNFPSTRATMVSEEQELPVVTLTEILELEDM
ncbi:hypothetical protein C8J55DRAFT_610418 [Lentinula edodes]|uniref:DUF6533 domain-containing protein n=1 Tax=Lentinula lateritia TaxID=40482 RepID=A0A9W8ZP11_9AGAR|nr:hypothetical protein C8J55DRAFT_610418 [Lentinula edodes]